MAKVAVRVTCSASARDEIGVAVHSYADAVASTPAASMPYRSTRPGMPPLAAEVIALLPAADEMLRCAVHAADIGVDPGGTAISADAVALVEVPLPWPKPVFASGLLEGFTSMMDLAVGPTRVLAAIPAHGDETPDTVGGGPNTSTGGTSPAGTVRMALHCRAGAGTNVYRFIADSAVGLRLLFAHLARRMPTEPIAERAGFTMTGAARDERAVLICTQGSHDVCCGSEGTRLAADFEAVLRAYRTQDSDVPDNLPTSSGHVGVYRVSHTGGHRFAPTAMTLPDGRMWAGIEAGELAAILDRTADAHALAPRCRGWWGAPTGPAQVAERAVFERVGWPLEAMAREIRFSPDGTGWDVQVAAGQAGRTWTVSVTAGRTVPTIACRALGGLPAKPATEFEVTRLRES